MSKKGEKKEGAEEKTVSKDECAGYKKFKLGHLLF